MIQAQYLILRLFWVCSITCIEWTMRPENPHILEKVKSFEEFE
jgi:hypothetical protein